MGSGPSWEQKPVTILLTSEVKLKQERLVARCDTEVYWMGFVDVVEVNDETYLKVYDLILPEQEVSSSSVDFDGKVNDLVHELIADGREDDVAKMLYFAHSHVNMGVFHSLTDVEQIIEWGEKAGVPWFISHVQNKRNEMDTRVDCFVQNPVRMHFTRPARVIGLADPLSDQWAKDQLEARVTKATVKTKGYEIGSGSYGTSTNHKLDVYAARTRYPGAKEIYIRMQSGIRQLVVDGFILEEEDTSTGTITYYREPTEEEKKESEERKRAEGKAQAPQDGAAKRSSRAEPLQTQIVREVRSDDEESRSGLVGTEDMEMVLPLEMMIDDPDDDDLDLNEEAIDEWRATLAHFFGHVPHQY